MQKISPISLAISIFVTIFVLFSAAYGTTSAQDLKEATECGSNIDLQVSNGCTIENEVRDCKNSKPASMSDAEKNQACNPQSQLEKLIKVILNVFSAIVGSIAVIMVIVGGFRYVTSGGDSNNISGAKNTILYAIVGLIIVAFAQILVRFVLQRI